jgi:hypothetical protein
MADYAHVTAYGAIKVGREKKALEVWTDAIDFYEKAQANGQIESYEIQIFLPTGGALPTGMITLWGSEEQIDAVARNEDRRKLAQRASLVVEDLVETRCMRGAAVLEGVGQFQEAIASL